MSRCEKCCWGKNKAVLFFKTLLWQCNENLFSIPDGGIMVDFCINLDLFT